MSTSPLRTSKFRITFIICWLSLVLIQMMILNKFGFSWMLAFYDSLVSNLILGAFMLLVSIMLKFYIPQKNKYGYILTLCGVLSGIWLVSSRSILMLLISDAADYNNFFSQSLPVRLLFGFLLIGCMALVSVLWYTVQDQQETDKRKTEAEQLTKEAELYKLRQQLQPHFLFNSLNSINALIGSKPQQARTMIQQLSDFLRGTLRKEEHQWTSLQEELLHLQLYLDIEKVRFGHRLSTEVINRTDGLKLELPAMLLQPVVENAIKFGLYDTTGDITISIEAEHQSGELVVQVKNPFDPQTSMPNKGTGFGLMSVQRRLYLLFARNDLLKTDMRGQLFITTIKIPQKDDQGDNRG